MSRLKFLGFATAAMVGSVTIMLVGLLAADLYAHSRVERSVGVNRQGYRGQVVGPKQPGARRIVMLGGSTVFGWDVALEDTIPAVLERLLRERHPGTGVVNLGFIGEGAHAFSPTLQDFSYLNYDVVCLYEGYNDLLGDARPNVGLSRDASRETGGGRLCPAMRRTIRLSDRNSPSPATSANRVWMCGHDPMTGRYLE